MRTRGEILIGRFSRNNMATVSKVAVQCGIRDIPDSIPAENSDDFYDEFSKFALAVQGEVARIRIRGRRSRNSVSVQLTDNTRTKIEHYAPAGNN